MGPDASRVVDHVLAQYEVDGCGVLRVPAFLHARQSLVYKKGRAQERIEDLLGHGIRPTLAHATSLGGLQAAPGSAAGHSVGNAVRVLVYHDVVFERTIASGLGVNDFRENPCGQRASEWVSEEDLRW